MTTGKHRSQRAVQQRVGAFRQPPVGHDACITDLDLGQVRAFVAAAECAHLAARLARYT
jgi:hypothetical protein